MEKQRRYFLSSGFSQTEKSDLQKKLNCLNGILFDVDRFPANLVCHLLFKKLVNTEKLLTACAIGTWILKPKFVEDSLKRNSWQAEAVYESSIHCSHADKHWLEAATRWRIYRQISGHGPFSDWIVLVLIHDQKNSYYSRVLIQGGAAVVKDFQIIRNKLADGSLPMTHVFVDESGYVKYRDFIHRLLAAGALCLKPFYITDFLLLNQMKHIDNYKIRLVTCRVVLEHMKDEDIESAKNNVKTFIAKSHSCIKLHHSSAVDLLSRISLVRMSSNSSFVPEKSTSSCSMTTSCIMPTGNTTSADCDSHKLQLEVGELVADDENKPAEHENLSAVLVGSQPLGTDDNVPYRRRPCDRIKRAPCMSAQRLLFLATQPSGDNVGLNSSPVMSRDEGLLHDIHGQSRSVDDSAAELKPTEQRLCTDRISPNTATCQNFPLEQLLHVVDPFDPVEAPSTHSVESSQQTTEQLLPLSSDTHIDSPLKRKADMSDLTPSKRLCIVAPGNIFTRLDRFRANCKAGLFVEPDSALPDLSPSESNVGEKLTREKISVKLDSPDLLTESKTVSEQSREDQDKSCSADKWKSRRIIRAASRNILVDGAINKTDITSSQVIKGDDYEQQFVNNEIKVNSLPCVMLDLEHLIINVATCGHFPSHLDISKIVQFLYNNHGYTPELVHKGSVSLNHFAMFLMKSELQTSTRQHLFTCTVEFVPDGDHKYTSSSVSHASHWQHLHNILSAVLECEAKHDDVYQSSLESLLHYYCCVLQSDFESINSRRDGSVNASCVPLSRFKSERCLLAKWLWADRYSPVMNSCVDNLLSCFIKSVQAAVKPHESSMHVLSDIEQLVCITAECCLGDKADVLQAVYSGTRVYAFCNHLAKRMHVLTVEELELALSTLHVDWLVLHLSRMLLDHYTSSSATSEKKEATAFSLKSIVSEYCKVEVLREPVASSSVRFKTCDVSGSRSETTVDNLSMSTTDINKRNLKGETKLHVACRTNNISKVERLLRVPGIDVNIQDWAGWTPLHEACANGHTEIVKELINFKPAVTIESYFKPANSCKKLDISLVSKDGTTVLHDAVVSNHIDIALLLVTAAGSHLLDVKDTNGKTPRDLASDEMKSALSELLLRPAKLSAANKKQNDADCSLSSSSSVGLSRSSTAVDRYLVLVTSLVHRFLLIRSANTVVSDDLNVDVSCLQTHVEQLTGGQLTQKQSRFLSMLHCATDIC